jgi:hypothetical protein
MEILIVVYDIAHLRLLLLIQKAESKAYSFNKDNYKTVFLKGGCAMGSHSYRVEIIKGLLEGEESRSLELSEYCDGLYSVTQITHSPHGYLIDFVVRDSFDHLDQSKLFFEVLNNGTLFSGVRTIHESVCGNNEGAASLSLDDEGLDAVLQLALEKRSH